MYRCPHWLQSDICATHHTRCSKLFWQIRQLWKTRRFLSVENAMMLVHSLVAGSVLYRVAAVHFHPVQSVINAAARIVLKLRKFDRVSISRAIRNELHWLPIGQRVACKLCLMVYKCQHHRASSYMSWLCVSLSSVTTVRHMRAATQGDLNFPRTTTVTFGSRAFTVSGFTCWNSLYPYS